MYTLGEYSGKLAYMTYIIDTMNIQDNATQDKVGPRNVS